MPATRSDRPARRVLMLGWEYPPHLTGGLGTACQGLASALVRRGARVTFVLPHVSGDEPDDGVRLVEAPAVAEVGPYGAGGAEPQSPASAGSGMPAAAASRRERYGRGLGEAVAAFARGARKVARRDRFDVVHAHDWMTYAAGIAAAKAAEAPLIVHVHSCEHDRAGPAANPEIVAAEQAGFDVADLVVCVSRYTAGIVRDRYDVDPAKLRVVHNAGPGGVLRARRARRRIPEPIVLFLGRLTYQKGPEVFLEAAARVARKHGDVRFVVAGTGDLYHRCIELTAELGIGRRVHFTGFLDAKGVAKAFRNADVYVMPSVSEPFGIAPLEAASHGVPVLVSERSGVAEVLPSAVTFDPDDAAGLARRLLGVLASPEMRKRMAASARREVARLHWDAQAERLLGVYAEFAR